MRLIDADKLENSMCGKSCANCRQIFNGKNVHANCSEIKLFFLKLIYEQKTVYKRSKKRKEVKMELYDIKASEAISILADDVKERHPNITKAMAKKLVVNALVYNLIAEEIADQVDFIISKLEEEGEI